MRKRTDRKAVDDDDYVIYTQTKRRRKVTKRYIAAGSWTLRENEIYLQFLQTHPQLFQNEFVRRSTKVFRKMSSLLRRRDPEQCRSHHQKLVIKSNGKIETIIQRLRQKIERSKKKIEYQEQKRQDKNKNQNVATGTRDTKFVQQIAISKSYSGDIKIVINLGCIMSW